MSARSRSGWRRVCGNADDRRWLRNRPLPQPHSRAQWVNEPQTEGELDAIRRSVTRSQPYGREDWVGQAAASLGLESAVRPRGRPQKGDR